MNFACLKIPSESCYFNFGIDIFNRIFIKFKNKLDQNISRPWLICNIYDLEALSNVYVITLDFFIICLQICLRNDMLKPLPAVIAISLNYGLSMRTKYENYEVP